MYQDYPHFFTATILEWKKRIAYKNLSHLCSQSAIDLFAAVGGLRHTHSGFGEHLQGLQKHIVLGMLLLFCLSSCRQMYCHNKKTKHLPLIVCADSLQRFSLNRLPYLAKKENIYFDGDTTDERINSFIVKESWGYSDYKPVPTVIYRCIKFKCFSNLMGYLQYNDKGTFGIGKITYCSKLPYFLKLPYGFFNSYDVAYIGYSVKDCFHISNDLSRIDWKEAINLSRFYGVKGKQPYINLLSNVFYDSIQFRNINCYMVIGDNKKYVFVDDETGKVIKTGKLRLDTITNSPIESWEIPIPKKKQILDSKNITRLFRTSTF